MCSGHKVRSAETSQGGRDLTDLSFSHNDRELGDPEVRRTVGDQFDTSAG